MIAGIRATPHRARHAASVLGVTFIAALGIPAPFTIDIGGPSMQQALAGRGGGNGGGHGGGHGHGRGGISETAANLAGVSGAEANARRTRADRPSVSAISEAKGPAANSSAVTGKTALALGALNAAHASEAAFANASEQSVIGKLSAYMDEIKAYLETLGGTEAEQNAALEAAADDLADAANKDTEIDAETVDAVNTLLDGKAHGFTHEATDGDPVHDAETAIADLVNQ